MSKRKRASVLGRPPIDPELRSESVTISLPCWMKKRLDAMGDRSEVVRAALLKVYKWDKKGVGKHRKPPQGTSG